MNFSGKWMELENTLSKVTQTHKDMHGGWPEGQIRELRGLWEVKRCHHQLLRIWSMACVFLVACSQPRVWLFSTSGQNHIHDLKLYNRAIVIKTTWYWYRDRKVDQWNRIEGPEVDLHPYGHLIFDKEAKTIQWNKESIFNKWCWSKWQSTCRRVQIDPYLSFYKAQVQVDQGPQHKTRYSESNRRESGT